MFSNILYIFKYSYVNRSEFYIYINKDKVGEFISCNNCCMQFVECDDGTFGRNCSGLCGHCQYVAACHKETGECPPVCQQGYEGIYCNRSKQNLALGYDKQYKTLFVM